MLNSANLDPADIAKCDNYLVVNCFKDNRAHVIDVSKDEAPVVKEIAALGSMNDPENYVITGTESEIISNHSSSYYIKDHREYDHWNRKLIGIYRSFTEIDLEEMKRIKAEFIE